MVLGWDFLGVRLLLTVLCATWLPETTVWEQLESAGNRFGLRTNKGLGSGFMMISHKKNDSRSLFSKKKSHPAGGAPPVKAGV